MSRHRHRHRWIGAVTLAATLPAAFLACADDDAPVLLDATDVATDATGVMDAAGDADAERDADAEGDTSADVDDRPFVVPDASVQCATTPCVKQLVGAADSYCALLDDGTVSCWGLNSLSRYGEQGRVLPPTKVDGLTRIVEVASGLLNMCARDEGGAVYCTGDAYLVAAGIASFDAGENPPDRFTRPTLQDAVPRSESVAVGGSHACVTTSDALVVCWGMNYYLELGRGPTAPYLAAPPEKATLLDEPAASVIGGDRRTFVVTPDGRAVSWGANSINGVALNFLLGRDTSEDPNGRPTIVPTLSGVRGIATGSSHACALAGRFVECWGTNDDGQLGRGNFEPSPSLPGRAAVPATMDTDDEPKESDGSLGELDVPVQVVVGAYHSCAVLGSGRVFCWGGTRSEALLGREATSPLRRGRPTRLDLFGDAVVALAVGGLNSMCALLRSGAVECWGDNRSGELGMGRTDVLPHPTPVRVNFTP